MHRTCFRSDSPFSHVPRALDTLHRIGFSLASLNVRPVDQREFVITLQYCGNGNLHPETYLELLRRLPGLMVCERVYADGRSKGEVS